MAKDTFVGVVHIVDSLKTYECWVEDIDTYRQPRTGFICYDEDENVFYFPIHKIDYIELRRV